MKLPNWLYCEFAGLHRILFGAVKFYDFGLYGHTLKLFGFSVWAFYGSEKQFWFRIFNYGLAFKHESLGLTFSQRNGIVKIHRIGRYIVTTLKPNW